MSQPWSELISAGEAGGRSYVLHKMLRLRKKASGAVVLMSLTKQRKLQRLRKLGSLKSFHLIFVFYSEGKPIT